MSKKVTSKEKAIAALTTQIRVGLAKNNISAADMARMMGKPPQTVSDWVRHPDKLNMHQWQLINSVLHLDPVQFNIGAGFVRGGTQL